MVPGMRHRLVRSPVSSRRAVSALAVLGLLLTACGGGAGSEDGTADDVASLDSGAPTDDTTDGSTESSAPVDPDEAFLAYTECMREEGIDLPDPQVAGEDRMVMAAPAEDLDMTSEEFEAAQAACEPLLQEAMGNFEVDPEMEAEAREEMLAFAECMREHGIDMPDPEFSSDGGAVRIEARVGERGEQGGGGPAEDPFADEEFKQAADECGGPGSPGMRVGGSEEP